MKRKLEPTAKEVQQTIADTVTEVLIQKYGGIEFLNFDVSTYVKNKSNKVFKGGNTKFMKVFDKEIKMLYENDIINVKDLGFLTLIGIYFTGYEDNILRNSNGNPCTQKDIIETLKTAKSTLSPALKKLVDKQIIFEIDHPEVVNGKAYYLNPMIFYRGTLMEDRKRLIFEKFKDNMYAIWKDKEIVDKTILENKQLINDTIEAVLLLSENAENSDTEDSEI